MKTNMVWKVVVLVAALAVILFGGLGITGAAAQSAIPGDALYPVKTTIEGARLSLARDAGDRAQMKLAFAEERLTEIGRLIREGRYREIREAVLAFESNIHAAIIELQSVSAADPARAAQISQVLVSALTRYAQTLSELAVLAPESVKQEVTRALDTTQIASGLPKSSGNENESEVENENSNVNANDNSSDDDSNMNTNDDSNSNSNVNVNSNDDNSSNENEDSYFDDNSNSSNTNDDDLYDDKHNSNSSIEDSNSNSSFDDSSNDNSSQDDNSNDDHSDDNDNSDDHSSDDGNSNSNDDGGGNDNGGDD